MSIKNFTAAVAALGLLAVLPSGALAAEGTHQRGAKTVGIVTAVGSSSLTITGKAGVTKTITVTADTKLRAPDRDASGSVTLADIIAGDKVKIHLLASDPTVARSVKVEALKIAGTVAAVGKDSVTITLDDATQKTLTVNADTKLKIPDTDASGSVTLDDLKVGDAIRVKAIATAGNTLLALSINAKGTHKRGSKTVGIVTAVGSSSLTITDKAGVTRTITVNADTKLRAPDRDASGSVTLADIIPGDKVKIHLSKSDPTVARSVKVKVEALMIAGTVAAVGKDSVTITLDDATQKTLTVNADTKLRIPDRDGSGSVTLDDLKVGDKIKVETSATDATLAVSIDAKGTHQRGAKTVGIVTAVDSSSLTITNKAGVTTTITVNSATKLRAPDRDASGSVTLADILVGDKVKIQLLKSDRTVARSVKVEALKIVGTVAAVGADSVTITLADATQKTLTVNADTKLEIPDTDASGSVTLADLKVGDAIRAKAIAAAGGTLLALRISAGEYATGNGAADRPSHDGPRGGRGDRGDRGDRGGRGGRGR